MNQNEFKAACADQRPRLLRYAQTLTHDSDLAEDLVQETLTRALERAGSYRGEATVATWLHRILYNLLVDRSRRNTEEPIEHIADLVEAQWRLDSYTVEPEVVLARLETRDDVLDALSRLPVDHRAAVVLHDVELLTAREIAAVTGGSLAAVKQRIRRGRMMLVSLLAGTAPPDSRPTMALRCWQARRHISDYLDDELSTSTRSAVEHHLRDCPTCPPLYASLVATTERLGAVVRDPNSVVPAPVAQKIKAYERPSGPGK